MTAVTPAAVLLWTLVLACIAIIAAFAAYAIRFFGVVYRRLSGGGTAPPDDASVIRSRRNTTVIVVLIALVIIGLVLIPFEPDLTGNRWIPLDVAAIGVALVGAFIGFLFGLPQLSETVPIGPAAGSAGNPPAPAAPEAPKPLYRPSTNLEKVADRTATLLAGVALAQIVAIPGYIAGFADYINGALGNGHVASAHVLATGVLLYFAPTGFILSFLCTKTIVGPELAHADESLAGFAISKSIVDDFPIWPDVPQNPRLEQQIAAQRIIARSLSTLTTAAQKATWARAQVLLNNADQAIIAYQQAQVLTPRDAQLIADYAQALYTTNDSNAPLALSLAQQAVADKTLDAKVRARLQNLIAVCELYIAGGYEDAIATVNATLNDPDLSAGTRLRFYRACGFGQMWRALVADPSNRPDRQRLLERIGRQIRHDTRISLAYPELKAQFMLVTVPNGREIGSHDDDLQAFARVHPDYRALLNIHTPIDEPTTPVPPPPKCDIEEILEDCPA